MPTANLTALALLGPIGWQELVILAVLGVLIFGKRLPEVGRSIGRGIVEFKKGLSGIEEETDKPATPPQVDSRREPPRVESRSDTTATPTPSTESSTRSA